MAAFLLQKQGWLVVTGHMACKPKIFTIWPLRKKVRWSLQRDEEEEGKRTLKASKKTPLFTIFCVLLLLLEQELTGKQIKVVNTELYIRYWESDGWEKNSPKFLNNLSEVKAVLFRIFFFKRHIIYIHFKITNPIN